MHRGIKEENGMKVIEVRDLCFGYERADVLHSVSFSIQSGDFAAVIGSNGAGKSTLLKLITGLLEPDGGSVKLFGTELSEFREWSKVGYVPQNSTYLGSNFPATALEIVKSNLFSQIGFLHFARKIHKQQALEALGTVGMQEMANRMLGSLSGGQLQRVMLARVLVNQPEILLLDEPTTGLDEHAAKSLYELLQHLNRDHGITVVMVTHDVERASRYVGRVLTLGREGMLEQRRQNR